MSPRMLYNDCRQENRGAGHVPGGRGGACPSADGRPRRIKGKGGEDAQDGGVGVDGGRGAGRDSVARGAVPHPVGDVEDRADDPVCRRASAADRRDGLGRGRQRVRREGCGEGFSVRRRPHRHRAPDPAGRGVRRLRGRRRLAGPESRQGVADRDRRGRQGRHLDRADGAADAAGGQGGLLPRRREGAGRCPERQPRLLRRRRLPDRGRPQRLDGLHPLGQRNGAPRRGVCHHRGAGDRPVRL